MCAIRKELDNNIYCVSVSLRINIKGGGVHQWYMTLVNNVQSVLFFSINFKIKGWGSAMVPPFGGNTD